MRTFVLAVLLMLLVTGLAQTAFTQTTLFTPPPTVTVTFVPLPAANARFMQTGPDGLMYIGMDRALVVFDQHARAIARTIPIGSHDAVRPDQICFHPTLGTVITLGPADLASDMPFQVALIDASGLPRYFDPGIYVTSCGVGADGTLYLGTSLVEFNIEGSQKMVSVNPTTLKATKIGPKTPNAVGNIVTADGKTFLFSLSPYPGIGLPNYLGMMQIGQDGTPGFQLLPLDGEAGNLTFSLDKKFVYFSKTNQSTRITQTLRLDLATLDLTVVQQKDAKAYYAFSGQDSAFFYQSSGETVNTFDLVTQKTADPYYLESNGRIWNIGLAVLRGKFWDTVVVLRTDSVMYLDNWPRVPYVYSVLNSGTWRSDPLAPNTWISLFGRSLSFQPAVGGFPFPTTLDTAKVELNGKELPLYYASPNQINALVPADLAIGADAQITVKVQSGETTWAASNIITQPTAAYAPGILAITDASGLVPSSKGFRAAIGDYLTLYNVGLGPVTEKLVTGQPAPTDRLVRTLTMPTVTVGGVPANVTFSGLAPGYVGLYQVNIQLPSVPDGNQDIILSIGNVTSAALRVPVGTVTTSDQPKVP